MTNYVYRKNYKGEMLKIGHLSPKGHINHYATFIDPDESYKENRKSHRTLYCKNKLGLYVDLSVIQEQIKTDNFLVELRNEK